LLGGIARRRRRRSDLGPVELLQSISGEVRIERVVEAPDERVQHGRVVGVFDGGPGLRRFATGCSVGGLRIGRPLVDRYKRDIAPVMVMNYKTTP